MKGRILGFKTVNYTSADGRAVNGISLYLAYNDIDVYGENVKSEFISSKKPLFNLFQPYLDGKVDKLINKKCTLDYIVEQRNGKTFSRLNDFILED